MPYPEMNHCSRILGTQFQFKKISRSKEMHHCPPAVGIQFQFLGCLRKRRMKMGGSSLAGASPDGLANLSQNLVEYQHGI